MLPSQSNKAQSSSAPPSSRSLLCIAVVVVLMLMAGLQIVFRVINIGEVIIYWDHVLDRVYLRLGVIDTTRPQLIPRVVYQTWYTRDLPEKVVAERRRMQEINPGYEFRLFLDQEMDKFVENNFEKRIFDAYSRLNIVTAKADFWRYLVLYKNGGVYIDMDSAIIKPLASLIREKDEAILTVQETVGGAEMWFAQWGLMFAPRHPVLNRTIESIVHNIRGHKSANSTLTLTGPVVFSDAINSIHHDNFGLNFRRTLVRGTTDMTYSVTRPWPATYRIYGIDYNNFFRVKFMDRILNGKHHVHWRDEEKAGKPTLKPDKVK